MIEVWFDLVVGYLGILGGFVGFCEFVDVFNDSFGIFKCMFGFGVYNVDVDVLVVGVFKDLFCGGNLIELIEINVRVFFE